MCQNIIDIENFHRLTLFMNAYDVKEYVFNRNLQDCIAGRKILKDSTPLAKYSVKEQSGSILFPASS